MADIATDVMRYVGGVENFAFTAPMGNGQVTILKDFSKVKMASLKETCRTSGLVLDQVGKESFIIQCGDLGGFGFFGPNSELAKCSRKK